MSLYLIQGAVEEGLIYALVALGLLVSYGILGLADMTTDGTFVLGSAVSSVLALKGHPVAALVVAMVAGAGAGLVTALLHTMLKIPSILAGIITMTALYSINLMVQGGIPNLFYDGENTVFTNVSSAFGEKLGALILLAIIVAIVGFLLVQFFKTRIGLSIRATGDNPSMVEASSINPRFTITIGLCISNAMVALGGALWSQRTTQGDINIGTGVVVIGLASLVLGRLISRRKSIFAQVIAAIAGAVMYRIIFTVALRYTQNAGYLKIVSAVILAVVMGYPSARRSISDFFKRRKEAKSYVNGGQSNKDI